MCFTALSMLCLAVLFKNLFFDREGKYAQFALEIFGFKKRIGER